MRKKEGEEGGRKERGGGRKDQRIEGSTKGGEGGGKEVVGGRQERVREGGNGVINFRGVGRPYKVGGQHFGLRFNYCCSLHL